MDGLFDDLRLGFRILRKSPGFAALAIIALALGIGANTAIFSVVNSVLLRPLPYHDPERLVVLLHDGQYPVSPADFLDYQRQAQSFELMAAAQAWGGTLTGMEKAEAIPGLQVSSNMFSLLGVPPALGRTFAPGDEESKVLVLSFELWQRRFAGGANVIGRSVTLNGSPYTIVGVMPPGFRFAPFWQTQAEMWTPLALGPRLNDRRGRSLRLFARLKTGVALSEAQSEIDVVSRRITEANAGLQRELSLTVVPLHEKVVKDVRRMLAVLLATVAFVLLIACGNVANLLLARAVGRRKEAAVRLALGSSRLRLIRQFLSESVVIAIIGGGLGVLLARWGVTALLAILPEASLPRQKEVVLDSTVLLFTILISLVTGVVCGLVPALRASRADLNEALKGARGAAADRGGNRLRRLLIAGQVALALVLLAGAGLMMRTLNHLQAVDPGFDSRNLVSATVAASGTRYPDAASRAAFFERLEQQLQRTPGVESAGLINHLPINGDVWTFSYLVAGRPVPPPGREPGAVYRVVTPGYFRTMRIPVRAGRDFDDRDRANAPGTVIVNERMARRLWPGESPLGQSIAIGSAREPVWRTIVGVSRDVKQSDWTSAPGDEVYLPHAQAGAQQFAFMTVVARIAIPARAAASAIEAQVQSVDPNVPVSRILTMEEAIGGKLWRSEISRLLLGVFAALALVLAAVGIHGVVSYSVFERTGEIGIRIALGARTRDVARLVLGQSLATVAAGLALGMFGAWSLSRAMSTLLYGVRATDPLTYLLSAALLAGAAMAASIPAFWRAIRIQPQDALRN